MLKRDSVLIIEDDEAISKFLQISLEQQGYKTTVVHTLQKANAYLNAEMPSLILLDLGLPDGDGKNMIKSIRSSLSLPIIVISARDDEKEIIGSLDLGADDYITKPFSIEELLARIRSIQRRFMNIVPTSQVLTCGDIKMDIEQKIVHVRSLQIKLTPTEFSLLQYLIINRNKVLTHAKILKEVWGIGYQNEMQHLRTYINLLRKKIEEDTTRPFYIRTELGIGYRFYCSDM